MPLVLPKTPLQATKRWTDQKFLMLGPGKVGKSAFWAHGEKTLFLEVEPGLNHLSVMKVPVRSWEDFKEAAGELYRLAHGAETFPYDTIVIDTYDKLVDRANEAVIGLAKQKYSKSIDKGLEINTVGDVPEGNGWAMATSLVHLALDKITEFPAAIVLISHVANREMQDGVRKYQRDTISVGGQMGTKVLHWADHTLHVRAKVQGEAVMRMIRTRPSESIEAGSRGNMVPDGFLLEGDLKASYQKFRALFE